MRIKSLGQLNFRGDFRDVNNHNYTFNSNNIDLEVYIVGREDVMRIDNVALSMYDGDVGCLEHIDVLLHMNGIDNPLNIVEGMELVYPPSYDQLDAMRIEIETKAKSPDRNVQSQIGFPNKTTRKDSNRKSFVENGYSLPPTVSPEATEPVRVQGDKIIIGGVNKN